MSSQTIFITFLYLSAWSFSFPPAISVPYKTPPDINDENKRLEDVLRRLGYLRETPQRHCAKTDTECKSRDSDGGEVIHCCKGAPDHSCCSEEATICCPVNMECCGEFCCESGDECRIDGCYVWAMSRIAYVLIMSGLMFTGIICIFKYCCPKGVGKREEEDCEMSPSAPPI